MQRTRWVIEDQRSGPTFTLGFSIELFKGLRLATLSFYNPLRDHLQLTRIDAINPNDLVFIELSDRPDEKTWLTEPARSAKLDYLVAPFGGPFEFNLLFRTSRTPKSDQNQVITFNIEAAELASADRKYTISRSYPIPPDSPKE